MCEAGKHPARRPALQVPWGGRRSAALALGARPLTPRSNRRRSLRNRPTRQSVVRRRGELWAMSRRVGSQRPHASRTAFLEIRAEAVAKLIERVTPASSRSLVPQEDQGPWSPKAMGAARCIWQPLSRSDSVRGCARASCRSASLGLPWPGDRRRFRFIDLQSIASDRHRHDSRTGDGVEALIPVRRRFSPLSPEYTRLGGDLLRCSDRDRS